MIGTSLGKIMMVLVLLGMAVVELSVDPNGVVHVTVER